MNDLEKYERRGLDERLDSMRRNVDWLLSRQSFDSAIDLISREKDLFASRLHVGLLVSDVARLIKAGDFAEARRLVDGAVEVFDAKEVRPQIAQELFRRLPDGVDRREFLKYVA